MKDIIIRTLSGILFIGVMLGGLLVDKFLFAALFILMIVGMMAEFYRMTFGDKFRYPRLVAILTGVTFFVLIFCNCVWDFPLRYTSITIIPLIVLMAMSIYSHDRGDFPLFSHIYAGLLYIAVPISVSSFLAFDGNGNFDGKLLLYLFIIIWSSDVGAYLFGFLLGRRFPAKLFPSISPKKTWVGFAGGAVCSILAALVMTLAGALSYPVLHGVGLALVMHVAGVYGDLFESLWKRIYDLKDSGNIIPGHGGLLDRFDSSIMALPSALVYLVLAGLI